MKNYFKTVKKVGSGVVAVVGSAISSQLNQGRSMSHTHVKEEEENYRSDDTPGAIGRCSIYAVMNKAHIKAQSGAKILYYQTVTGSIISGSGQQNMNDSFCIGSASQWLNSTANFTVLDSCKSYFALNPNDKTSGSSYFPAGYIPLNDRLAHISSHTKLDICNGGTIPLTVSIVVFACKKLTNLSPAATANNGAIGWGTQGDGIIVGYTAPAGGSAVAGVAGFMNNNYPHATCDTVPGTRDFWRRIGSRTLTLGGAAQESIDIHVKMNKVAKFETINTQNAFLGSGAFIPPGPPGLKP